LLPLFSIMADALVEPDVSDRYYGIIAHFWENRKLARVTFSGATRPLVSGFLADLIQERLAVVARKANGVKPLVPARLMAAHLAEAQLGTIVAWCSGTAVSTPEAVAQLLHLSANVSASAWAGRRMK
jgi:hypothetical protein